MSSLPSPGVGGLFLLVSLLVGNSLQDGYVFAIGVTVALVPEALLPTVTLSLAWGAEQMAKRQILVRNLEAWTPAGAVTVEGSGYGPEAGLTWSSTSAHGQCAALALAGMRCSTGYAQEVQGEWQAHGDPMEAALDAFARRLGIDTEGDRRRNPVQLRFPFDPRLRRMSVVVDDCVDGTDR